MGVRGAPVTSDGTQKSGYKRVMLRPSRWSCHICFSFELLFSQEEGGQTFPSVQIKQHKVKAEAEYSLQSHAGRERCKQGRTRRSRRIQRILKTKQGSLAKPHQGLSAPSGGGMEERLAPPPFCGHVNQSAGQSEEIFGEIGRERNTGFVFLPLFLLISRS